MPDSIDEQKVNLSTGSDSAPSAEQVSPTLLNWRTSQYSSVAGIILNLIFTGFTSKLIQASWNNSNPEATKNFLGIILIVCVGIFIWAAHNHQQTLDSIFEKGSSCLKPKSNCELEANDTGGSR